jgi:hypothetical protein
VLSALGQDDIHGGDMRPTLLVTTTLVVALLSRSPAEAASGWKKDTEKDRLTGKTLTFIRGYSSGGEGLRNFDVLRPDGQFVFRFVVPQMASPVLQGFSVRVPEELGEGLSWSVDGKSPHTADPQYTKRKAALSNTADYQASWPVGCEELRELAIGGTLRIVTPNFSAEIPLRGFTQYLEKVYGITQQSLISRTASICSAAPSSPPQQN